MAADVAESLSAGPGLNLNPTAAAGETSDDDDDDDGEATKTAARSLVVSVFFEDLCRRQSRSGRPYQRHRRRLTMQPHSLTTVSLTQ